jgi:hypothetical protein
MPLVIILRDDLYDIVIATDNSEKLYKLYNFAISLNPTDETCAPMNSEILKTTGELWVTSRCVVYNDEADFRSKFPDRRTPMRLDIRHAEKTKWYHGIVDLGIRYFSIKALSEDATMASISDFPQSILTRPRKATPEQLLEHYMWLTDLRVKNSK